MKRLNRMRWLGLGALFGGILFSVYEIAIATTSARFHEAPQTWTLIYLVGMVATLFMILGVIGLYAFQAGERGVFGLAAFILALIGLLAFFGFAWGGVMIIPAVVAQDPEFLFTATGVWQFDNSFLISSVLLTVGILLFGIMTWRTAVMPRPGAALIILGSLIGAADQWDLGPLDPSWGPITVAGIGFIWLGVWLWWFEPPEET